MIGGQRQQAEQGAVAVQAGGDVTVGITPTQMTEILTAMAGQLIAYGAAAQQTQDERLHRFREDLLIEFSKPERADPAAFADPDFQATVAEAQEAFVRSGQPTVGETLIGIVARRSKTKTGSRAAMALNDAVLKAAKLTKAEIAAITVVHQLKNTQRHLVNFPDLAKFIEQLGIIAEDISEESASFWHIEAQNCGKLSLGSVSLREVFTQRYGGLFSKGFTREALEGHIPGDDKHIADPLLTPCLHDRNTLQFSVLNKDVFKAEAAAKTKIAPEHMDNIWGVMAGSLGTEDEMLSLLAPVAPHARILRDRWENTPLKQLELNTVGIAIGHADATTRLGLDAGLEVWIK